MKVYIAAPFFNNEQLSQVKDLEVFLEANCIQFFSPRSFGVIKDMTLEEQNRRMEEVYNKNIEELQDCDVIVCFVDDKDTGTIFELGYSACIKSTQFWAKRNGVQLKPNKIITYSPLGKPVNVMLRYCLDAHANSRSDLAGILLHIQLEGYIPEHLRIFPEVNE